VVLGIPEGDTGVDGEDRPVVGGRVDTGGGGRVGLGTEEELAAGEEEEERE
jgi:hypothetical protein